MSIVIALALQAATVSLDYGAAPTQDEGIQIGETYIKHDLADPYSAHIEWPFTFVPFTEKVPMFKRTTGYATCVTVNAKNLYGAYTGEKTYRIIIRDGKVIDYAPVSASKFAPDMCKELATKFGMSPAAPAPGAPH